MKKVLLLHFVCIFTIYAQSYQFSYSSSDHNKSEQRAILSAVEKSLQVLCVQKNMTYSHKDYNIIFDNAMWLVKTISSSQKKSFFGLKSTINVNVTVDVNMLEKVFTLTTQPRRWSVQLHYKVLPMHKNDAVNLQEIQFQIPFPHHVEQIGNDEIVLYLPRLDSETLQLVKEQFIGPRGIMLRFVASSKIGPGLDMYEEKQKYISAQHNPSERNAYIDGLKKKGYLWMRGKDGEDYLLWLDDPYNITTQNFKSVYFDHSRQMVDFSLNEDTVSTFAAMTEKNKNQQLAIISQGQVVMAPVIQDSITGGKGVIQGMNSQECSELVHLIKSKWVDYLFSLQQEKQNDGLQLPFIEGVYAEVKLAKTLEKPEKFLQKVCADISKDCQITPTTDSGYTLRISLSKDQSIEDVKKILGQNSDINVSKIALVKTLYSTEKK